MNFTNQILDFIKRRFPQDCNGLNGNCLGFALILRKRFPTLEIYYMPIKGHFIVGTKNGTYFDGTGIVTPDEELWSLRKIKEEDILLYNHLIRDCLM